jgi:hypothetical protein
MTATIARLIFCLLALIPAATAMERLPDDEPPEQQMFCAEVFAPVCGSDQQTYSNRCKAQLAKIEVIHEGECGTLDQHGCPQLAVPDYVCGKDGKTYPSRCQAERLNIPISHSGRCQQEELMCSQQYEPVCGTNNKTYSNSCHALRAKVMVRHQGQCGAEP